MAQDATTKVYADDGVYFSGSEHSSSHYEPNIDAMKEYWLGKKYFESAVAKMILQQSDDETSWILIDSKFEAALQDYDFNQRLSSLRTLGANSPRVLSREEHQTPRVEFINLLGSILRQGSKAEKRSMDEILEDNRTQDDLTHGSDYSVPMSRNGRVYKQEVASDLSFSHSEVSDIAYYTMRLKEEGDRLGIHPIYTDRQFSLYPPKFLVTLIWRDKKYEGVGSSKRQARHEASKAACMSLEIGAF